MRQVNVYPNEEIEKRYLARLEARKKAAEALAGNGNFAPDDVPESEPITISPNAQNLDGFIYVPSIGIYVAKERSFVGEQFQYNWERCHKELNANERFMPTPHQFVEFLKYLKNGYTDKKEAKAILEEITAVREPWRSEWLDAKFEEDKGVMYINYQHGFDRKGKLIAGKREKLDNYLSSNKQIDLNDCIANANKHGLPLPDVKDGKLYYWSPVNGRVAGFDAYSGWAGLNCGRDPANAYSVLGVRACAPKK